MENKKSSMGMDALKLFLITMIAGLLLGLVYQITKEPIEQSNLKAKNEAYQKVFPEAAEFAENAEITSAVEDTAAIESLLAENELGGTVITEVLEAKDASGTVLGYVASFTAKEGYGGDISLSMGVAADGTITGFEVLSASETAGLGANCTTDGFKSQFAGINSDRVEYTKMGKNADNEIDALSGATITTKAITKAVNSLLLFLHTSVMK